LLALALKVTGWPVGGFVGWKLKRGTMLKITNRVTVFTEPRESWTVSVTLDWGVKRKSWKIPGEVVLAEVPSLQFQE